MPGYEPRESAQVETEDPDEEYGVRSAWTVVDRIIAEREPPAKDEEDVDEDEVRTPDNASLCEGSLL